MSDTIGFGAASIGNLYRAVDEVAAAETLEAAWDAGIRYYDTAPHYGLGLSERRLGDFLSRRPRDEFRISTKAGRLLRPNPRFAGGTDVAHGFVVPDDVERVFDPSADGVRRSLDESLTRLQLDRVDILYLHDPDAYDLDRGLAEGLPALIALREEGVVAEVGIGVNDAAVAARAVREADVDVVMIAGRHTLLEQSAARDLLSVCAQRGVRVVAAAVFNSGLLAADDPRTAHYDYGKVPPPVAERTVRLGEVCRRHDVPLPAAALQFPLRDTAVSTVVFGTARAEAVRQNAAYARTPIPAALWQELAAEGLLEA